MAWRNRPLACGRALTALVLALALLSGGCGRPSSPPADTTLAVPPSDTKSAEPATLPLSPVAAPPVSPPDATRRYPPYRYHVEGPDTHLVGKDAFADDIIFHRVDYWIVGRSPVVIEIQFDEAAPEPGAVVRHIRELLGPGAHVHEEGYEADRAFVKATLPPGRHVIFLPGIGTSDWNDHRALILDRGWPLRLMRWEPGGSPEVLGEYDLPTGLYAAALETGQGEAFFGTVALSWVNSAGVCLWHWQSGAQPSLTLLGGLWEGASIVPRDNELLVRTSVSLLVVDRGGEIIGPLVEGRLPAETAVKSGGEVAVFVTRGNALGGLELDLTLFNAALETYRTWDGICPQGRFNDAFARVEPIWYGDEVFFLALDDRHHDPPMHHLMAFDVNTASVRWVLGPFAWGRCVGQSHYALLGQWGADWVLWDAASASLRALPSARELGESQPPWPVAVGGNWVVFAAESGLLGWHPSMGVTRLGHGMAVVRAGDAFLWWTDVGR